MMQRKLSFLLRRLRARYALRVLGRATWVALAAIAIGLAGHRLWGWPAWSGAPVAAVLLAAGFAWALFPRGGPYGLARRMDARLGLQDRMTTALEVSQRPVPPGSVGAALIADAELTYDEIAGRVTRRAALLPRDVVAFAALLVFIAGLAALFALDAGALSRPAAALPARGGEPAAPPAADQPSAVLGAPPQAPASDASTLGALASALRDQAATRAAADALDHGDVHGAADALRGLADQVGGLSDQGKGDLARALRSAAGRLASKAPDLSSALENAAGALESGSDSAAAQALQDLAGRLDQMAGGDRAQAPHNPQPGNSSASQSTDSAAAPQATPGSVQGQARANGQGSTRLGGGGDPMQLGTQPGDSTAPMPSGDQAMQLPSTPGGDTGSAFTPARGSSDIWQAGADVLSYPWEWRHVVESYFTR